MPYFVKLKDLTCNFCGFYHFFNFSASFYPNWMKIISKFRYILGLHVYHLGSVLDRSKPVLALTKWKDRDRGPGPVRSISPMRSLGPDL